MIGIQNLQVTTSGGKVLLSPISFQISQGMVLGLYGPNGSGKSTLLKTISGNSSGHQIRGSVLIDHLPFPESLTALQRVERVLYLGSDFQTSFDLTVRELFEMASLVGSNQLLREVGAPERDRITAVVEVLKIVEFLPRFFRTLSDGEKQLMMFARALIQSSKVIILDETFSKLDLDKLILVGKVLREHANRGIAFLVAAHDLNFLSEISDELLFLKSGKLLGKGTVEEMLVPARLDELYPDISLQVVTSPETGKWKILY